MKLYNNISLEIQNKKINNQKIHNPRKILSQDD